MGVLQGGESPVFVTLHLQHKWGKVIGVGVHIYVFVDQNKIE